MALFGTVSVAAAVAAVLFGHSAVGILWFVLGIPAGIATAKHYAISEDSSGLSTGSSGYFAVVAVLALGTFGLPIFLQGDPAWAIALWTGTCYLGFSWLERSATIAAVASTFLILGVVFLQRDFPNELAWFSALSGAALLVGAFFARPTTGIR